DVRSREGTRAMAKILQCPSCRQGMDVTGVAGGSPVQCPDCGHQTMVPSAVTSVRVKTVSAPIPAAPPPRATPRPPPPPPRRDRSRSGTMPLPPQPKSSSGLFVGLAIGALAVVIVVIVFVMREQSQEEPKKVVGEKKGPSSVTFNPNLPKMSDKPIVLNEGS